MSLPITLDRQDNFSLQEQIYRFIRDRVLNGDYSTGVRLPSSRDLAGDLGVSRTTVLLAYEWLSTEGYLETHKGIGTFVCNVVHDALRVRMADQSREPSQHTGNLNPPITSIPSIDRPFVQSTNVKRPPLDFWYGGGDWRQFPIKAWRRAIMQQLASASRDLSDYGDQAGVQELRIAIAEHISTTRGFRAEPQRIVITSGAQEALNIVSRLMVRKSDKVAIEDPGYAAAGTLFLGCGAQLIPVPVDHAGICVGALNGLTAKLVYTTPSHQFPTGALMSIERRQQLLSWALATQTYVIEDDYDSELIYDRPPLAALAALDHSQRVIYIGSFSKSLGAGIRIGFLILPEQLVASVVSMKSMTTFGQSWLEQRALASFIQSGGFRLHLRHIRRVCRLRRDTLIAALRSNFGRDVDISGEDSGQHFVWTLPAGFPAADSMISKARDLGVGLYSPARAGAMQVGEFHGPERRLLMGYCGLTPKEIELAVHKIATIVNESS